MRRTIFAFSFTLFMMPMAHAADPVAIPVVTKDVAPAVPAATPAAMASSTTASCSSCATNTGWSYYGLNGGGPNVVTFSPKDSVGRPWPTRIGDSHRSGYSFYIPPTPPVGPTAPRTLRLGWMTYRTPAPRIENNVSVYPQPR